MSVGFSFNGHALFLPGTVKTNPDLCSEKFGGPRGKSQLKDGVPN